MGSLFKGHRMSSEKEKIIILGSGAMGCLFAAHLAAASQPVVILDAWQEGIQAIQNEGVRMIQADGSQIHYSVQATTNPLDCRNARYALVCVKSWQTHAAAKLLAACLAPKGVAITLQNGLGNYEILSMTLGAERASLGTTTFGAALLAPGLVKAGGEGEITLANNNRLAQLRQILELAEIKVRSVDDLTSLLWGKLVINAAINPITALLGISNGEILRNPNARNLAQQTAEEAVQVANAMGIQLPYELPLIQIEQVLEKTAANQSSMLQDLQRRAPTEIDQINGAIVRYGEMCGVPTPINQTLVQLLKAKLKII